MGTKNPKISAYVPQEVFDRFQEFQNERDLSASKAATAILCDYFGIKESAGSIPSGITLTRIETLEQELADLREEVRNQPVQLKALLELSGYKSIEGEKKVFQLPPESKDIEISLKNVDNHETPQLPFPDSESQQITSELLSKPLVLSGKELAERWSISSSKLSTEKGDRSHEQFTEWSKKIDPDGFAWTYRGKQKGKGVEYLQVQ